MGKEDYKNEKKQHMQIISFMREMQQNQIILEFHHY